MTTKATLDEVITILKNEDAPLNAKAIYGLSDLSEEAKALLYAEWGAIPTARRRLLVERLSETSETNFEMDFSAVFRLALTDLDPSIRHIGIEASWIDESPELLNRLMPMAAVDTSPDVRAAAAGALGRFILQGELDAFDPSLARQAQNLAIKLYKTEKDIHIRRRALEAISNSSREEVTEMIREAYANPHSAMKVSAVFAMGRSYDERWSPIVLHELTSDNPEMRFEAVRACGELELTAGVPLLAQMLDEDEDREILDMAIWSLGEIGGSEAISLLETMSERAAHEEDEALAEAVDEALANANLAGQIDI